jgi:hypothetical protein
VNHILNNNLMIVLVLVYKPNVSHVVCRVALTGRHIGKEEDQSDGTSVFPDQFVAKHE